jgi:hypothetical protein
MRRLEELYPETPMLPAHGSEARAAAEAMLLDAASLSAAGFRYASSVRNQSLTDADRQERRAAFEERLDHLETCIGQGGGPFLCGAQLGLVDAMYAPFLERWAIQLPLTSEFHLRPARGSSPRWPKLKAWFGAMASVPAYGSRVSGDAYSWSAAVATFQRMFSPNGTLTDAQRDVARRADSAALLELKRARDEGMANGIAPSAALAAAKVRRRQCRCSSSRRTDGHRWRRLAYLSTAWDWLVTGRRSVDWVAQLVHSQRTVCAVTAYRRLRLLMCLPPFLPPALIRLSSQPHRHRPFHCSPSFPCHLRRS